jgi:hypothetical protein
MVTISKKNNKISSREHSKALIIFLKNTSIVYVHVEAVLRTNTITQTEVFHFWNYSVVNVGLSDICDGSEETTM